ncbi:phage holin family protein [Pseudogemmobacter faecipullorum]|uniref:Phage holin family protein n=1 Tax=Pseudogemmobacter faecipullorum TaxID=2755041 RepID=A0ABS8CKK4_9RHOB|nr:phage holin family protein [Pseudogemmobacter faecipullorum]MCB5409924.1 phage holin family protein [Pseudogemmobacter faecipullorum]
MDPQTNDPHEEAQGPERPADSRAAPGLIGLISELASGLLRLLRDELSLAKLEARFALRAAALGLGLIAVALVLMLFAAAELLVAARAGLVWLGLSPGMAALSLGGGLLLLALLLIWLGARKLRLARIMAPRRLGLSPGDAGLARHLRARARDRSE